MPKRKTVEQRLAEVVAEMGVDRAEEYFKFIRAFSTGLTPKTKKSRPGEIKKVSAKELEDLVNESRKATG